MPVDNLGNLKSELPELFEDMLPPLGDYEDEYIVVPADSFECDFPDDLVGQEENIWPNEPFIFSALTETIAPVLESQFPGGPIAMWKSHYPPPDALAFYLPFHYYYPTWWGIYLTFEGVYSLGRFIHLETQGFVSIQEAFEVAQLYLYGHEAFHHIVESFATRLEVTHREPLYKNGFEAFFQKTVGTDKCMEEAIACVHGYNRVDSKSNLAESDPDKHEAAKISLIKYIKGCPEGYRKGTEIIKSETFLQERSIFGEENQAECFNTPRKDPSVWASFPHAFSGISNVRSRTNYLVRKNSPLGKRIPATIRYFTYREVVKGLKKYGCSLKEEGKGSHQKWISKEGSRIDVPKHPGELNKSTIKSIIRQAGLRIPISEFLS